MTPTLVFGPAQRNPDKLCICNNNTSIWPSFNQCFDNDFENEKKKYGRNNKFKFACYFYLIVVSLLAISNKIHLFLIKEPK